MEGTCLQLAPCVCCCSFGLPGQQKFPEVDVVFVPLTNGGEPVCPAVLPFIVWFQFLISCFVDQMDCLLVFVVDTLWGGQDIYILFF